MPITGRCRSCCDSGNHAVSDFLDTVAAENNIRSATVVGMLAGGGIGYLMSIYQGGLYIGYMGYQLMASCILLIISR